MSWIESQIKQKKNWLQLEFVAFINKFLFIINKNWWIQQ